MVGRGQGTAMSRTRKSASPFSHFNASPEVIRLAVLICVRFPLSLRNVEDLLFERGIDIRHQPVPHWWNRSGPPFLADPPPASAYGLRLAGEGGGFANR